MSANESPVTAAMNSLRAEPAGAACEWLSLEHLAHGSERIGGMVVRSAQVRKVLKTISRLSPYKATVLIHGESGTGKELVACAWRFHRCARGFARLFPIRQWRNAVFGRNRRASTAIAAQAVARGRDA